MSGLNASTAPRPLGSAFLVLSKAKTAAIRAAVPQLGLAVNSNDVTSVQYRLPGLCSNQD